MMEIDLEIQPSDLAGPLQNMWPISARKITTLCTSYDSDRGSPVFTVHGRYTSKGWTEWTQGFQYGWAVLQFDATGDATCLELGRKETLDRMAFHVSHIGVHDHGFNNVSTYGHLRRLMLERRMPFDEWELNFYEMALKASAAVQAARWSRTFDGSGYIHSFNGPHSLFADTMRSLRSLSLGHHLGHCLMGENDERIDLLDRMIQHARTTAEYNVFYGQGRDVYDVPGRVAHESVFNPTDGRFRTSATQQGYSPFTTWTRGLAWVMTGFAEQLEYIETVPDSDLERSGGRQAVEDFMLRAAIATCDYYIQTSPTDGIPYWDTGAPGLAMLADHTQRPADPHNPFEPVDSSAAAIGAQGLLRLGSYLERRGLDGRRYRAAGLGILARLLQPEYLSDDPNHQGLLLHGVYHRPRGWDHCPDPDGVPRGESVMWGDYHLIELSTLVQRVIDGSRWFSFFSPADGDR